MAIRIKRNVAFSLTAIFDTAYDGQTIYACIYNTANRSKKTSDTTSPYADVSATVDSTTHMATFNFTATKTNQLEEGLCSLDLYKVSSGQNVWMATAEKFATAINVSRSN